jgi:hypothetical protein
MNSATVFTSGVSSGITVYTPVFFPFFESIYNNLDLTFVEQLQLRCVVNTAALMGSTMTAGSFYLWMNYWNLDSEAHSALKAQNFKPDKPLTMLGYDVYTERFALDSTAKRTAQTAALNVNNCVFESYMYVYLPSATAYTLAPITDYTLKLSGRTIHDTIPQKLALWDKAHQEGGGTGDLLVQAGLSTQGAAAYWKSALTFCPISICWGMDTGNRTYNSSAISFANVNSPTISTNQLTTGGDLGVFVVSHSYWTLISINSSDGRVERFLST